MIMPHILTSRWFVVLLSERNAVTLPGLLHSESDVLGCFMNRCCRAEGEVSNIFIMFIGEADSIAVVVWPLVFGDYRNDLISLDDYFTMTRREILAGLVFAIPHSGQTCSRGV